MDIHDIEEAAAEIHRVYGIQVNPHDIIFACICMVLSIAEKQRQEDLNEFRSKIAECINEAVAGLDEVALQHKQTLQKERNVGHQRTEAVTEKLSKILQQLQPLLVQDSRSKPTPSTPQNLSPSRWLKATLVGGILLGLLNTGILLVLLYTTPI